jgi:hypothetical protein
MRALLAVEKHKADDTACEYPSLGGGIRVPLLSPDKRESFFLDITRSQIRLTKPYYQHAYRGSRRIRRRNYFSLPLTGVAAAVFAASSAAAVAASA